MLPILDGSSTKFFPAYRNTLRIRHATSLLREGAHLNTSIEGIAEMSGFKSKSIFYTAFKEEYGTTPPSGSRSICKLQPETSPWVPKKTATGFGTPLVFTFRP